jgi:hypothetical protein
LMTDKGMDTTRAITTKTMTTLTTIAKETVTAATSAATSTATAPKNPYDKIHKLGESQSTARQRLHRRRQLLLHRRRQLHHSVRNWEILKVQLSVDRRP